MRTLMRLSFCLLLVFLSFHAGAIAAPRSVDENPAACLRMTVAANDIASLGGQVRQHYRIFFENLCDTVRVVYWCAEHPSQPLTMSSVCSPRVTAQAGIAAPLYAVTRKREFQWTFPRGTQIRFVDCDDSAYPTSDLRCTRPGAHAR